MRLVPKPGRIVKGDITLYRRPKGTSANGGVVEEVRLSDLDVMSPEMRSIRGPNWR